MRSFNLLSTSGVLSHELRVVITHVKTFLLVVRGVTSLVTRIGHVRILYVKIIPMVV